MICNENLPKKCLKYFCEFCNYETSKKSSYDGHMLTSKHNKSITNKKKSNWFECGYCLKIYKDNSGLWRHKKKCNAEINTTTTQNIISSVDDLHNENKQQQLINYLMKENTEFKQLMMEQNKQMFELANKIGNNTIINNNTHNNTNNSFNLNFFLNETCKNAMNINDFIKQLPVGIETLEEIGRTGFTEGISKIFINGLKQIKANDRPLHCTDYKRETLYIKDNDQWIKDNDDKTELTKAIKQITNRNIDQIFEWQKLHPEYTDPESKQNDIYLHIVLNSMPGSTTEETNKNYEKIVKNIIKKTIVEK